MPARPSASLTTELILRDRDLFEDVLMQAQARGNLRTDLTPDEVATFVAMITTASVAMNQPKPQRLRYLRLMVDALSPAAAQNDARPQPKQPRAKKTRKAAR